MIALWGIGGDPPLDTIHEKLAERGAHFVFVDQRVAPDTALRVHCAASLTGSLVLPGQRPVRIESIRAAYLRPEPFDSLHGGLGGAEVPPVAERASRAAALDGCLWRLFDALPGDIANRPSAMRSNASKPYQAGAIRRAGFDTPESLLTTDPEAVRAWRRTHPRAIYKSISGVRSIVRLLGDEHDARLDAVTTCPTQFQAYVPGQEIRVHVVGDRLFATSVDSDDVDYRYGSAAMRPTELPEDVAARCHALATSLELPVAGLDLRVTPEGRWICFEVNPSPAFACYEAVTGQPIAAAVADWLCREGNTAG